MHKASKVLMAALVAGLGWGVAQADVSGISKEAYKQARERIEQVRKADLRACEQVQQERARDACELRARGKEKIARAELEAQREPGPEAERQVKEVQAEVAYDLEKLRCKGLGDEEAQDRCLRQAKAGLEAAVRQAKVEKVHQIRRLEAQAKAAREAAAEAQAADGAEAARS